MTSKVWVLDDGEGLTIFAAGQVRPNAINRFAASARRQAKDEDAHVTDTPEFELALFGLALLVQGVVIGMLIAHLRSLR